MKSDKWTDFEFKNLQQNRKYPKSDGKTHLSLNIYARIQ